MEERDFFDEKQEKKPASLNCPHCREAAEYEITWIVRTKKRQLGGRADERDRARFAKFRSSLYRHPASSRRRRWLVFLFVKKGSQIFLGLHFALPRFLRPSVCH
jgi:hypothetical protein